MRTTITIRNDTLVCPCHGVPLWREYRPDYTGTYRHFDRCTRDGAELGWDAAIPREQWLLGAQAARLAGKEAAA